VLTPWLDPACLFTHNDIVTLSRWMWSEAYDTDTILDAIEKPWCWVAELAQARADLANGVAADVQAVREIAALAAVATGERA